jgi:myo-inositol-1(or 4)-monophosphatase
MADQDEPAGMADQDEPAGMADRDESAAIADRDDRALLSTAEAAARAAASELLRRFGQRQEGVRAKSGPTDLVSDADFAAESAIRRVLSEQRPGDAILGEEGGESGHGGGGESGRGGGESGRGQGESGRGQGESGRGGGESSRGQLRWVVDPLDGTVNFLFGIPAFAVSVACEDSSGALAGIVLDPIRDECFAATRSGGSTLNSEAIQASDRADLATAMVATGFAYEADLRARQSIVLTRLLPRVRDIRRVGAAALDLAWCGCGRFDAYYERGVHRWDFLAGALIAERAGLEVRELEAVGEEPFGLVVAPAALIDELRGLVVG